MSWVRDLSWENIDTAARSSVAFQFARYALGVTYDVLPAEVVHQAKRCLLDAIGCAIGGYDSPGRPMCEAVALELGGPPESTMFGSGTRVSASAATLVNSFLVRFLDANDIGGGGHGSDAIAGIIAIGEREKVNGRELLSAIVASYELGARVEDSLRARNVPGWTVDLRAALIMPAALGKLMRLTEEQVANAIGSCACGSLSLGVADPHDHDEHTMRKNLRFGWVSYDAILACLLAKRGFTGPVRVVEGNHGWQEVIAGGKMNLDALTDFCGWRILETRHKYGCAPAQLQGHAYATIAIVEEHDLKPDQIASVHVTTRRWESSTAYKRYPRNAESGDHSGFYVTAVAIRDRALGPDQFRPELFTDPVILSLEDKITVESDPNMGLYEGTSRIRTTDGRTFTQHIANAHGMGNDPLTDKELVAKFVMFAGRAMPRTQIDRIFDAVWGIEKLDDLSSLTRLMVF